ncbi:UDP-glycosyltransferase 75D1 [Abeliophyllum distichum]|uniref:UDP-glycosyltransferase 75D1 n=1 Tax=Abeliophyllum distichum TaxID=126358 RepID=A0ABD1PZU3_9LAMI
MAKAASDITNDITFVAFSDGYDDGFKLSDDHEHYMTEIRNRGSDTLRDTILDSANQGRRVTCLVYSLLLPWAAAVAREVHIPCALLWIQPATVLDLYYYYFNGYGEEINNSSDDPSWAIQLPRLPLLAKRDIPSFMLPSNSYKFALPSFKEQLETLDAETKPKVLVNTFDALEPDALKAIEHYDLIGIGPLIPSAFLDGKDPSDKAVGGDLFHKSEDYVQWLNSKPRKFCYLCVFWESFEAPKKSIACGVPVVAFPRWTDQGTNAKLIQDVWRTGLRVNPREDDTVESDEIKRCIETIMDDGEIGRELRENAKKWKKLAREAMQEDGSSTKNLKAFVEELGDCC